LFSNIEYQKFDYSTDRKYCFRSPTVEAQRDFHVKRLAELGLLTTTTKTTTIGTTTARATTTTTTTTTVRTPPLSVILVIP
jgi:hypothetical protein